MSRVYHSWNAVVNRNVFKFDLEISTDFDCLINNGTGPRTAKVLSPILLIRFLLFKDVVRRSGVPWTADVV